MAESIIAPAFRPVVVCKRPNSKKGWGAKARINDISAIMGASNTAECFATHARPNMNALNIHGPAPAWCRWRHHAPQLARKKNAMLASEVTSAPWARKCGLKANKTSDRIAPLLPNRLLDQQKTRIPVMTLKTTILARPAISIGK